MKQTKLNIAPKVDAKLPHHGRIEKPSTGGAILFRITVNHTLLKLIEMNNG
jgi:hypothetical protein